MSAVLAVRVGNNVNLVAAAHRDGDILERETGQRNAEDDLERVGTVNVERGAGRFGSVVEDCARHGDQYLSRK
ncbi:hypothetical protein EPN29_13645 [bacterium]|nr:MAG: hypothetical protein EPN29_13645 [bacterium]